MLAAHGARTLALACSSVSCGLGVQCRGGLHPAMMPPCAVSVAARLAQLIVRDIVHSVWSAGMRIDVGCRRCRGSGAPTAAGAATADEVERGRDRSNPAARSGDPPSRASSTGRWPAPSRTGTSSATRPRPTARRTSSLVLIDDAGFGNPATFGGPIDTPNYTRMAERGLRYNRFHVTAICSPTRAALLTGRNNHTVGFGSIGELVGGYPGLLGDAPARLRPAAADPARQRLQHRRDRQVAPHAGWPAGRGRPVRSLAERLGVRLLLRLPRRRARASGTRCSPRTRRSSASPPSTATRTTRSTSRTRWPTRRSSGSTASAPRTPTSRSSCTSRPDAPRSAPRRREVVREVQGQVRPGLGPAPRGDVRAPEGARRHAARTRS